MCCLERLAIYRVTGTEYDEYFSSSFSMFDNSNYFCNETIAFVRNGRMKNEEIEWKTKL